MKYPCNRHPDQETNWYHIPRNTPDVPFWTLYLPAKVTTILTSRNMFISVVNFITPIFLDSQMKLSFLRSGTVYYMSSLIEELYIKYTLPQHSQFTLLSSSYILSDKSWMKLSACLVSPRGLQSMHPLQLVPQNPWSPAFE